MKYVAHDYSGPDLAAIASDLSLDPAYSKAHGKTAFVSFGLEQVKETDTTATRAEFLKQILAFLAEETRIAGMRKPPLHASSWMPIGLKKEINSDRHSRFELECNLWRCGDN